MALTLLFTTVAYSQITFGEVFSEALQRVESKVLNKMDDAIKYTVAHHYDIDFYSITVTDKNNYTLAYLFDNTKDAKCVLNILGYPRSLTADVIRYLDSALHYDKNMIWYDDSQLYELDLNEGDNSPLIYMYVTPRTQ